ncbi:MAG: EAL domain-containing protein [Alphaproteobacteria bacterium]|nr:MAG: EAL domain-containing protein [Alphaproteobacteria bacterium]
MIEAEMLPEAGAEASPFDVALSLEERALARRIEQAIRAGTVRLAFQPVVPVAARDQVAFWEGLLRIPDGRGGMMPAERFIPFVEGRELGRRLDCLALELGLAALRAEPTLRLSVNMSARSIGHLPWIHTLEAALEAEPGLGERLILEVTEHSAMLVPELVRAFMARFHARGVAFALDDFGAGYTAFRHFKDFTFDVVKIDGQFIRGLESDAANQVLTEALAMIARHFDMISVAEAVETEAEAEFCAAAGIDCIQGYLISAPLLDPPWAAPDEDGEGQHRQTG